MEHGPLETFNVHGIDFYEVPQNQKVQWVRFREVYPGPYCSRVAIGEGSPFDG